MAERERSYSAGQKRDKPDEPSIKQKRQKTEPEAGPSQPRRSSGLGTSKLPSQGAVSYESWSDGPFPDSPSDLENEPQMQVNEPIIDEPIVAEPAVDQAAVDPVAVPVQEPVPPPPPAIGPAPIRHLAHRDLVMGEQIAFSHWPQDPEAVTFHTAKRKTLKVAIRTVRAHRLDLEVRNDKEYLRCIKREMANLQKMSFKYFATIYDVFYLQSDRRALLIVQEWFNESLLDRITRSRTTPMTINDVKTHHRQYFQLLPSGVDLRSVKIWMGQIVQAIDYLHSKSYVHNRIEPNSIMLRGRERAVLSHFLCASSYRERGNFPPKFINLKYASAELVQYFIDDEHGYDAKANDVWGFGCTCAFSITGRDLFSSDDVTRLAKQQKSVNAIIQRLPVDDLHKEFLRTVLYLGDYNTKIEDVVKSPWFNMIPYGHKSTPSKANYLSTIKYIRARTFAPLGHDVGAIYNKMAWKGYAISHVIGKGGYGAVYGGTKMDLDTNEMTPVAMKLLGGWNKKSTRRYRVGYYPTELKILTRLRHPNLVRVYDVFKEENTHDRRWERRTFIWMERSKSDLWQMAAEMPGRRLPDQTVSRLIAYAMVGLDFLHDNLIAHRDIKPANILVFETPHGMIAKLTDYSMIKETDNNSLTRTIVGTPGYQPPQMLLKVPYNAFKFDVFAMGIVLFYLLTGRKPKWDPSAIKSQEDAEVEVQILRSDANVEFDDHPLQELFAAVFTLQDEDRCSLQVMMINSWFPDVQADPIYQYESAIQSFHEYKEPENAE